MAYLTLTPKPNQNIWFISDLHFSHDNIKKYHPKFRDFSSINEMNRALIDMWNTFVAPGDIVFDLGDFCFDDDKTAKILSKLNGEHYLITGNHDKSFADGRFDEYLKARFDYLFLTIEDSKNGEKSQFALSHYPIYEWEAMQKGSFHLYGHVHSKDYSTVLGSRSKCVCYDFCGAFLSYKNLIAELSPQTPRTH